MEEWAKIPATVCEKTLWRLTENVWPLSLPTKVYNKVLRQTFIIDQILIFHHNLQINSLKIQQCDFLDLFSHFVCHSWSVPMMKITGLSHLFKWENLHNWWLTKYFFAPQYVNRVLSFWQQICVFHHVLLWLYVTGTCGLLIIVYIWFLHLVAQVQVSKRFWISLLL